MKWYDKLSVIIIILLLLDTAVGVARFIQNKKEPQPQKKGQVVEKFMAGDQHFLQLTIAVSPEDYIGYDIGDEYEVNK